MKTAMTSHTREVFMEHSESFYKKYKEILTYISS